MLKEPEIEYVSKILQKKDQINIDQNIDMKEYYHKAKYTLKIIMIKMGLISAFEKLMNLYKKRKKDRFENTLIKLLYRCLIGYRSLHKL